MAQRFAGTWLRDTLVRAFARSAECFCISGYSDDDRKQKLSFFGIVRTCAPAGKCSCISGLHDDRKQKLFVRRDRG